MLENYTYRGVKGMRDSFPEQTHYFQLLESLARQLFACYQLGEVRTPLVEHTLLFERGVGQGTDIVNKEMFYVPAKDQDANSQESAKKMVLRPEATASVVRAYVEHEISKQSPGLVRYYYIGPMFRYERPQRGRLRQFTQIGVELIGSVEPALDAEAIILLVTLMKHYQLNDLSVELNSVGCSTCRPTYMTQLQSFARQHETELCGDCKSRLHKNPLRLFDCKQKHCQAIMSKAPDIQTFLCQPCITHQDEVMAYLKYNQINYQLNSRLMRGLDYYTRTVFEVLSTNLGAQNAVAAGGRYDKLVKELDGPDVPAIGWSIGLERVLELLDQEKISPPVCDAYIVAPGEDRKLLFQQVLKLRHKGFSIGYDHEPKSTKALLKKANKLNARYSIFVSLENSNQVELKDMQSGEQTTLSWQDLPDFIRKV